MLATDSIALAISAEMEEEQKKKKLFVNGAANSWNNCLQVTSQPVFLWDILLPIGGVVSIYGNGS